MPSFEEAWADVVTDVERFCRSYAGRFGEADDLLQQVRLHAWMGHGGFDGRGSYRAWVLRIAKNQAIDMARARMRRPAISLDDDGAQSPELARALAAEAGAGSVVDALASTAQFVRVILSHAVRSGAVTSLEHQVLAVRFEGGGDRGWQAIAPALGITPANAAQLHGRAIAKLRVHLFVAMPDIVGGLDAIAQAFQSCQQTGSRGDRIALTASEAATFETVVLRRGPKSAAAAASPTLLRAACQKVIRFLASSL